MNTDNKISNENQNPNSENLNNTSLKQKMSIYATKYRYYIIFGLVLLTYQFILREYHGDALLSFSKFLDDQGLISCLMQRYEEWTSRILIEIPLLLISKNMNVTLWRLIDMIVMLMLMHTMMKLTQIKDRCPEYLLLGLMILFPYQILLSAGWLATSMNYTWPVTALMVSMISLYKMYKGNKVNVVEGVIYLLLLAYGTNFETLGIVHIGLAIIIAIYMIIDHNMTLTRGIYIVVQILISTGNIIFSLTCPGNWNRNQIESANRMRDMSTMTVADKLTLGVNDTFSNLIDHNVIFLIFTAMLIVLAIYSKRTNKYIKFLSAMPFAIVLSRTIGYQVMASYWEKYNDIFDNISKMDATKFQNPNAYLPFILYMVLLTVILVVMLSSIENIRTAIMLCVVLGTSMLTRVAMGFSPTIYASKERTFTFLMIGMIYCIIRMYQEVRENIYGKANPAIIKIVRYAWAIAIAVSFIGNLTGIGSGR